MKKNDHIKNKQPLSDCLPKPQRGERGQSLVELAISLTVIMILLAGAVDFGMAYFSFAAMQDAAQEGALYGSVNPDDTAGIETRVRNASTNPVDLSDTFLVNVNITVTDDVDTNNPGCEGDSIKVEVIYDYPLSMPFIGTFIGSQTITLRATVTDTILRVC